LATNFFFFLLEIIMNFSSFHSIGNSQNVYWINTFLFLNNFTRKKFYANFRHSKILKNRKLLMIKVPGIDWIFLSFLFFFMLPSHAFHKFMQISRIIALPEMRMKRWLI
jgi:hypothetical protein